MKNYIYFIVVFVGMISQAVAQIKIPFQFLENKMILLKLPVEGRKDSVTFFFDTGATVTMLDKQVAKKLNIKPDSMDNVGGSSGTKSFELATNQKIKFNDDVTIEGLEFILDDVRRYNEGTGYQFDGIIGNDILFNFLTEINIDERVMKLYPKDTKLNLSGYKSFPFTMTEEVEIPHIPVKIKLKNNELYEGIALFDSGAALNFLINGKYAEKHRLLEKFDKLGVAGGNDLYGKTKTSVGLIKGISIPTHEFNSTLVTYISSDKVGVNAMEGYLGLLGAGVIYRYNMVLDYTNHLIYVKPTSDFNRAFHQTVNPLRLKKVNNKLYIDTIVEQSDAFSQGIKENMEVIAFNGKTNPSMAEINHFFLNKLNKKITLKVKDQNGIEQTIKFKNSPFL